MEQHQQGGDLFRWIRPRYQMVHIHKVSVRGVPAFTAKLGCSGLITPRVQSWPDGLCIAPWQPPGSRTLAMHARPIAALMVAGIAHQCKVREGATAVAVV
jgi:hypothetical protein